MSWVKLHDREEYARRLIAEYGSMLVALSGGVDSAALLALAVEALEPGRVLAVTGRSPAVPAADLADARRVAAALGSPWREIETHELEREGYRGNAGDRCFHCREELFERLGPIAVESNLAIVAYGAIVDDLGDDRPGMRSAELRGVAAPLLAAGIDKVGVRAIAARHRLPVRDKPAAACLASRIPAGTRVTPERLRRIGEAERRLRALGLRQLRVRDHGVTGRIEADDAGRIWLTHPANWRLAVEALDAAGFERAILDPRGYRPGGASTPGDVVRPLLRIGPARDTGQ